MIPVFLFGVLMGLRHAFEADHLAAVASLATRSRSLKSGLLQGTAWGLGHTLTLLLAGGTCLLLGRAMPQGWATGLELLVGIMLLVLGLDVLWRIRRQHVHVHVHGHGDGTRHWHAHPHAPETTHDGHEHRHPHRLPARALVVGLVHGLAGSAALLLLTLQTVPSPWLGLGYIALFGAGSMLGMAVLSAVIMVPLRAASHLVARLQRGLEALVGAATVVIGLKVVYQILG